MEGVRWTSSGWEPYALTAHVRIYEGATSIVHGSNIVTPPRKRVANRENKPYPKHKRIALLTRNAAAAVFEMDSLPAAPGDAGRSH